MQSWQKILGVQNMQDYIVEHIKEPITLLELARASGYSPYHAARIFKELTGKAPFDYIRSMRLNMAAEELIGGGVKIVDVAFDFVFGSHEGFSRAFKRAFGANPKAFRNSDSEKRLFMPENIRNYYLKFIKGEGNMTSNKKNTVFVQIIKKPKRRLILKRGIKATHYFEYCQEVGCDIYDILGSVKEAISEPMGLWLPINMIKPNTSIYAQGVEVMSDYDLPVPEGMEIIDLAPCDMMVFQGAPYDDNDFEDAISELWEAIKNYNPEIYGYKWADELAPRFQLRPEGYRGYIEGKPVIETAKK